MKLTRLFETGNIGKMETKNRIVMMPLVLNYSAYPYDITKRYIDIMEERARGGVGLIIVEATCVAPEGRMVTQLCVYDDSFVLGLNRLAIPDFAGAHRSIR